MNYQLRNVAIFLLLIAGMTWSLRMQTGDTETGAVPPKYPASVAAGFSIMAFRGTLRLAGHTASQRHEDRLTALAIEYFEDRELEVEFHPLGVVPAWWDDVTTAVLAALAPALSSRATLSANSLRIEAVVTDKSDAERRLHELRKLLPSAASLEIRVTEAATQTTARDYCTRQFASFEAGAVGFAESSAEFRDSAFPALDQVIALADACRDSTISITGHTDASGHEAWNRQLSLERARKVASYLEARGIDADRLVVAGAGSAVPIANNSTRFGRSINRRIDISFRPTGR